MCLVVVYWMRLSPFGMRDCDLAIQASSVLSLTLIFPLVDDSWKCLLLSNVIIILTITAVTKCIRSSLMRVLHQVECLGGPWDSTLIMKGVPSMKMGVPSF